MAICVSVHKSIFYNLWHGNSGNYCIFTFLLELIIVLPLLWKCFIHGVFMMRLKCLSSKNTLDCNKHNCRS